MTTHNPSRARAVIQATMALVSLALCMVRVGNAQDARVPGAAQASIQARATVVSAAPSFAALRSVELVSRPGRQAPTPVLTEDGVAVVRRVRGSVREVRVEFVAN